MSWDSAEVLSMNRISVLALLTLVIPFFESCGKGEGQKIEQPDFSSPAPELTSRERIKNHNRDEYPDLKQGINTSELRRNVAFVGKMKVETTRAGIRRLMKALENFHRDVGFYPSNNDGLAVLLKKPKGLGREKWKGPYMRVEEIDPWLNRYRYRRTGERYEVYSLGPDGKESADDIHAK
jgi:type II secretion system protein G